ncbi:hypothetical protein BGX34_009834 [Mortierella sp. NVP85]|nr:hypothetical protein BGX34_009834 [Mortierella sp. NVP85]
MATTSGAVAPNSEAYNGVAPTGTSGIADPASDGTLPATTATSGRRHRKGLFSRATIDMLAIAWMWVGLMLLVESRILDVMLGSLEMALLLAMLIGAYVLGWKSYY